MGEVAQWEPARCHAAWIEWLAVEGDTVHGHDVEVGERGRADGMAAEPDLGA